MAKRDVNGTVRRFANSGLEITKVEAASLLIDADEVADLPKGLRDLATPERWRRWAEAAAKIADHADDCKCGPCSWANLDSAY